jgi:hypothetical protein
MSLNIDNVPDGNDRLDEVVTAYLEAVEAGQEPNHDDWLARYADVAPALAEFFTDRDRVELATAKLRAITQALMSSTALPGQEPTDHPPRAAETVSQKAPVLLERPSRAPDKASATRSGGADPQRRA